MFRRTHVDEPVHDEGAVGDHEADTTVGIEPREAARSLTGLLAGLIVVALVLVELLLGGRLGFQMAEANPRNNFVEMVYDVSGPLVEPFEGIFSAEALDDGGIFDPNILIAMGVYLVAALLLLALLSAILGPLLDGGRAASASRHMHQH